MASRIPTLSSQNVRTVSPEELYNVICDAASLDPSKLKSSSERLKQMLEMAGTCDGLSDIACQRSQPLQIRQQCIIQLKNAVITHWRSRRVLPEDHRVRIRARCLQLLDESDDIIAECNELITSKIARSDYPTLWPNLVNDLSNVIQQNISSRYNGGPSNFLPLRRSLEILNAVMKELSTARMSTGIQNMKQVVGKMHQPLQAYYSTVAPVLNALDPSTISTPRSSEDILLAHLVFKCLAKCAVWLFHRMKDGDSKAQVDPWLRELFQNSVVQLSTLTELRINLLLALRTSQPSLDPITQLNITNLTRHVLLFGKFFKRLQQLDAPRFVLLPACSDLVLFYWSKVVQATNGSPKLIEDAPTAVFPVRYLVQAMVIFKESLAQWAPVRKDGSPNEQGLSKEFVEEAVKLLVTRFIPLNPSDLEEWVADPEEWVNLEEKENEQWQYELRPCGERVLMTLASQCQDYVVPLLETTWQQVRSQQSADLAGVLQKEALYCAIGRCASRMKGVIPFEEWLATDLVREVRENDPRYPILKRRIAWLVGKWISSECSSPNNTKIWEVLVHLLQDRGPGTDAVVRLTAAVALQECVDTLQFELDTFQPFLPTVVSELIKLQAEADTMESKKRIANSLNTIIERAGTHIVPLVGIIADPLPQLCELGMAAENDWLFKASLLGTVSNLITATKEHSAPLCALVVPLVRDSFGPVAKIQLDEDALDLLQTALRNTVTIDSVNGAPGLSELLPLAVSLLSGNLDIINKIIGVVESYCLLDPFRILQAFAVDIFSATRNIIENSLAMHAKSCMNTVNLLLQLTPAELWGEALHVSGLFVEVVKALDQERADSTLLMTYIFFMSRIALGNGQVFRELVRKTAPIITVSEEQAYNIILTQWWTRFDNMYEPRHRKLAAMGIAALVATGQPEVLDRLATEICNMWLDVFGEMREAEASAIDNDGKPLELYWDQSPEALFQEVEGMPEFGRRTAAYESDPVRTELLTRFITARLQEAEAACGGGAILQEKWLSKADPIALDQLKKELSSA